MENICKQQLQGCSKVLAESTLYFIPMYNPDGAEMNTRGTKIMATGKSLDLNRDWTLL
ncbi:M14 family zinc carboxypeptidase [Peribacillus alkalitolerans]|uniref:M14 family zinc carboxypeptidase n=1 Tax=Peribacillus alkalitolerans TaxID=1550385 RepID=UPI00308445CB